MQLKYLFFIASLQFIVVGARAQNVPNLGQASNPNSFSDMGTPQEVYVYPGMLNSITTLTPMLPSTDTSSISSSSPASNVKQMVVYLDGFQRPFQSVAKNVATVGNIQKNLIQIYDNRPQQDQYSFLPYSNSNPGLNTSAFQDQRAYYNSLFPNEGYTSFSKTSNSSNTTERSTTSFSPGKSGVGLNYGTRAKLITNAASQVIIWGIDGDGVPLNLGYYNAGLLVGTEGADPNAAGTNEAVSSPRVRVYKDKDGKVILKMEADSSFSYVSGLNLISGITYTYTYYVYDAKGNIRVTITPKAFKYYQSQGGFSAAIINNLCFQYQYDAKGRLNGSMKPGEKDFTYIVYDRKDRPVMRQTPNERGAKEWEVTFMDGLGRTKATSVYKDMQSTPLDHNGWQNAMDSWTSGGNYADLLSYLTDPTKEALYPVGDNPVSDPSNNAYSSIANNTIMTIGYYDSYSYVESWPIGSGISLLNECAGYVQLPFVSTPGAETPSFGRVYGMPTGSIVRILRSPKAANSDRVGDWRTGTSFYDDKGRVIYSKNFVTDNINSVAEMNTDYSAIQYDFAGRVLASGHTFTNTNSQDNAISPTHTEFTKNQYDAISGALVKAVHQVDGNAWKTLSTYTYDDMGRVKSKTLGAGGEVQEMSYNVRGQVMGINGTYAETGVKGGVSKTFGESLKYDYGFTQPRYDGKIAGMVWRGSSATDMYAYGYDYTQNGALKRADFNHQESGNWAHSTLDYSVSNLFYDKNGNMTSMNQKGTKGHSPVNMDVLNYIYEDGDISDRLLHVNDVGVTDYGAGDFQGAATNTYDPNGNLYSDIGPSKNIIKIEYTHFNKPTSIIYSNGNSIEYSYDATGNKVEELVVDAVHNTTKRTDYIGNAVYENTYDNNNGTGDYTDSLQYILTGDGRTSVNYTSNQLNEEYFVKDHLGNIRSVINVSGYDFRQYLATYELASAHLEDLMFDNIEDIRDIKPGGEGDNTMAANLNGGDPRRTIGTSLLTHVMAGDKVSMNVSTYFNGYDSKLDAPLNANVVLDQVVATLVGGDGGLGGSESHNTKVVQQVFNADNYAVYDQMVQNNTDPSRPKAYLNYVLFDENMQIVQEMSGAFQASGDGDWALIGTQSALEIPTNGYLAVYLSNTSTNAQCLACGDVYFDQLNIVFSHGNLLEENHYYPHGLPIFGLGSKTTNIDYRNNREKYQSNEYITDQGLNWMSFGARQYDPQIARFLSVDPLAQFGGQDMYSPYIAMGNHPESSIDPNGLQPSDRNNVHYGESALPWKVANSYGGESGGGFASAGWFGEINNGNSVDGTVNELMGNAYTAFAIESQLISDYNQLQGEAKENNRTGGEGGNGVGGIGGVYYANDEEKKDGTNSDYRSSGVKSGDAVYFKDNLKTTMESQVGSTCVPEILEYCASQISNIGPFRSDFYDYLNKENEKTLFNQDGMKYLLDGINGKKAISMAKNFFKSEKFQSFENSIDKGQPVFTFIPSDPTKPKEGGHAVLVVGYVCGTNNVIYMDPYSGKFETTKPNAFFNERLSITKTQR